jgi:putative transposase
MSLADARQLIAAWRDDYNEVRPHSAIGYNIPIDMHLNRAGFVGGLLV